MYSTTKYYTKEIDRKVSEIMMILKSKLNLYISKEKKQS